MLENKYLKLFFAVTITILTFLFIFLFTQYTEVLSNSTKKIEDVKKSNVGDFAKNIAEYIKTTLGEDAHGIFSLDENKRKNIESMLTLFSGNQYPYIYVTSKDIDGKYRYIFDGSSAKNQRGLYLQKFDIECESWNEAWKGDKPIWITQKNIDGLWVTYLYPIVYDNKTNMILAFDFSAAERDIIDSMFSPLHDYLFVISAILGIFLILIYFFGYLLYQQRKKSYKDPLTTLYNRRYLNEHLHNIDLGGISIAIIDLDHFKRVNDTYGHEVGDIVLKTFASRLRDNVRSHDIVIRYGGEEFLLFLKKGKKQTSKNSHEEIIKSLQKRISHEPIFIGNTPIKITASIGFNSDPSHNRSVNDAINVADKMLYLAKTSGRNRVEIYKEEWADKSFIIGPREVSQALNENRMLAYFQPIADARDEKIVRYEALVRLIDKDNNVITPAHFLPNIKLNTTYRSMSKFMLEKAFEMIEIKNISVSINFNIGDFLDRTLYELIYDIVSQNRKYASKLCIELLEDQEINNFVDINECIFKLQKLGVDIAVDDFGTGYSTFSYLLALNPNILKIDGFLIRKLKSSKQAKTIVSSIVELCKKLDIKVVAEFVESDELKYEAKLLGVDFLQGYAIGRTKPSIH